MGATDLALSNYSYNDLPPGQTDPKMRRFWLEVAPAPVSTPFQGAPGAIPGRIEAENFDEGGMNVAYYDETTANQGGAYRTEAVDIEASSDVGGGFDVGFVGEGEWLNYTVNVARSGLYTLKVRVASLPPGGAFYFAVDGRRVTRLITLPHTDGWQNWQTVTVPGVRLPAGAHVLQLIMNSRGYFGAVGNFNWFSFEKVGGQFVAATAGESVAGCHSDE
jgi:hypothetical protein